VGLHHRVFAVIFDPGLAQMPAIGYNWGVFQRYQKACIALAIFVAYAGLACLTTWPLAACLGTHLPSNSDDTLLHYWNGWWVQQALASGQSPLYTTFLFYPRGLSLVTHNIAWFQVLLWLALEPLVGGIAAYNLSLLFNLTLCGCAFFWLAHKLSGDWRAAFLSGLVYQAWPYRVSQLDHPNLLATYWLPLFFLYLVYTIRSRRWRDSLLAGLFFALTGYTRWQQLIPAVLMGLVYFAATVPAWLPAYKQVLPRLALAGGLATLLLLPPGLLLLDQERSVGDSANLLREGEEAVMQTDVLAYLTPASSHPVLGKQTQPLYDRYYSDRTSERRAPAYVGFVALLLALAGVLSRRKESLPWVLMAALLILLALGPVLRFNGQLYQVPMLYSFLEPIVLVRLMRGPDRFNVFLALPISMLAAYGTAGLLTYKRWNSPLRAALVSGLLSSLIVFEYLAIPAVVKDMSSVSPFYTQLAEEPGSAAAPPAVLDLPIDVLKAKLYMFEQVTHKHPILGGNISRLPDDAYSFIDGNPWLQALHWTNEIPPELGDVSRHLGVLARDNIRYIIIHKGVVGADRVAHWQRYLLIKPRYVDDRIVVYSTAPEPGRDYQLLDELLPGFGPIQVVVSTGCANPGRALEVDIGWGSMRSPGRDLEATLSFVGSDGAIHQAESFPLSPTWPTSQWPGQAISWGYYPLSLSPSLPAGAYTITLGLLDPATRQPIGKLMPIQPITVQAPICNLATEPEATDVNALFGDELQLLEYKLRPKTRRLDVTLYWRSQRRMKVDYKIFVHVFDPATDEIVAQDDAMPHRGAYPTTLWWPGETLEDRFAISLDGVPPGTYGIAVGVYDPLSGERLPAIDSQGQKISDNRLVLEKIALE
jgi:hypothetical protein